MQVHEAQCQPCGYHSHQRPCVCIRYKISMAVSRKNVLDWYHQLHKRLVVMSHYSETSLWCLEGVIRGNNFRVV